MFNHLTLPMRYWKLAILSIFVTLFLGSLQVQAKTLVNVDQTEKAHSMFLNAHEANLKLADEH